MPLFSGSVVYRLVLHSTLYGSVCDNVFYYGVTGGGANANNLAASFLEDVQVGIADITSNELTFDSVEVVGVQGAFDFSSSLIASPGSIDVAAEPKFVAWSYRLNRAAANERHGFKRFAGVPDSWFTDGAIDPTVIDDLNDFAPTLAATIGSSGTSYVPLIQRRFLNKVEVDPPEYYTFSTAAFVDISTQNTRKT